MPATNSAATTKDSDQPTDRQKMILPAAPATRSRSLQRNTSTSSAASNFSALFRSRDAAVDPELFKSVESFMEKMVSKQGGDVDALMSQFFQSSAGASALNRAESGGTVNVDSLMEDFFKSHSSMGPPPPSGALQRGTSINSLFSSRDWAPTMLGDAHVDVDPTQVFQSEKRSTSGGTTVIPVKDWNADFLSQLPTADAPAKAKPQAAPAPAATDWDAAVLKQVPSADAPAIKSGKTSTLAPVETKPARSTTTPSRKKNNKRRGQLDPEERIYYAPTNNDVLLGRGGRSNNHPGNHRYLAVKAEIQPHYLAADKNAKTAISQELVDAVHSWGGKFLDLDQDRQEWYEVSAIKARKKASQTLRELNTAEERAAKRARYGRN